LVVISHSHACQFIIVRWTKKISQEKMAELMVVQSSWQKQLQIELGLFRKYDFN